MTTWTVVSTNATTWSIIPDDWQDVPATATTTWTEQ